MLTSRPSAQSFRTNRKVEPVSIRTCSETKRVENTITRLLKALNFLCPSKNPLIIFWMQFQTTASMDTIVHRMWQKTMSRMDFSFALGGVIFVLSFFYVLEVLWERRTSLPVINSPKFWGLLGSGKEKQNFLTSAKELLDQGFKVSGSFNSDPSMILNATIV
jgi:hypothetical protein